MCAPIYPATFTLVIGELTCNEFFAVFFQQLIRPIHLRIYLIYLLEVFWRRSLLSHFAPFYRFFGRVAVTVHIYIRLVLGVYWIGHILTTLAVFFGILGSFLFSIPFWCQNSLAFIRPSSRSEMLAYVRLCESLLACLPCDIIWKI